MTNSLVLNYTQKCQEAQPADIQLYDGELQAEGVLMLKAFTKHMQNTEYACSCVDTYRQANSLKCCWAESKKRHFHSRHRVIGTYHMTSIWHKTPTHAINNNNNNMLNCTL